MSEFILSVFVPIYIGIGVPLTFALIAIGFRKTFNWFITEFKNSDFLQKILISLSLVLISPALIVTLILMLVYTIIFIVISIIYLLLVDINKDKHKGDDIHE